MLGLGDDTEFILIGLGCIGLAASLISIPVVPECLEAIEDCEELNYDPAEINNETSALFVTSTGVGETIGPIASAITNHHFGFVAAQD